MLVNGKDIMINASGINTCYDDLGVGGTPLLFIHGFPFDKSMWQPQMDFFRKKNRVIAYDIRGFGKSTTTDDETSISLFANDVVQLMDMLEIPEVIACGLSMGGYILLNAVNRYPKRFKAIVLSDTQCIADSAEGREKRYKTIELIKAEGTQNFAEGFVNNIFCAGSLENKKELVETIKQVILSTSPDVITSTLASLAQRYETCSALASIEIPTLIICGREDKITPLVQSEFMHKTIPLSELAIINYAGHMSNLEQPEIFNEHLSNFISGLRK
jgi:pimeloyl-ACP methyl ester carboxylesterase